MKLRFNSEIVLINLILNDNLKQETYFKCDGIVCTCIVD